MSTVSTLALEALKELRTMLHLRSHTAGVAITEEVISQIEAANSEPKPFTLNETQRKDMLWAALPLMRWIGENCHPHCTVIVDSERAELVEGVATARNDQATT